MDMSEVKRTHTDGAPIDERADETRWRDVVARIGSEVAGPLTGALERLNLLASTGKIERHSLRALRDEVDAARRAAMLGQQLARYASGRLRQSHERIDLAQLVQAVVTQRASDAQAAGLALNPSLKAVEVIVDPTLLYALLNAVVDWSLRHAHSPVELRLERKTWPTHGRLTCRFSQRAPDAADGTAPDPVVLDSLPWQLVQQIAWSMGLAVERHDGAADTQLVLEFPRTVNEELEGASVVELDQGIASSLNSKPLAGSHVLVMASRREVRMQVRAAIHHMGLIIDFVNSIDEAREFCRDGLPHAVVYESALGGEHFDALHAEIVAQASDFVFIEVAEDGDTFEVSGFGGAPRARIGRNVIATGLPSALVFELSRSY